MSVVYAIVGALLVILGAVVWKKQMVSVIAGYDKNKTTDSAGLAKWVGRNLMIVGALLLVLSIIYMVIKTILTIVIVMVPIALLVIFCIAIALGCKRFEK